MNQAMVNRLTQAISDVKKDLVKASDLTGDIQAARRLFQGILDVSIPLGFRTRLDLSPAHEFDHIVGSGTQTYAYASKLDVKHANLLKILKGFRIDPDDETLASLLRGFFNQVTDVEINERLQEVYQGQLPQFNSDVEVEELPASGGTDFDAFKQKFRQGILVLLGKMEAYIMNSPSSSSSASKDVKKLLEDFKKQHFYKDVPSGEFVGDKSQSSDARKGFLGIYIPGVKMDAEGNRIRELKRKKITSVNLSRGEDLFILLKNKIALDKMKTYLRSMAFLKELFGVVFDEHKVELLPTDVCVNTDVLAMNEEKKFKQKYPNSPKIDLGTYRTDVKQEMRYLKHDLGVGVSYTHTDSYVGWQTETEDAPIELPTTVTFRSKTTTRRSWMDNSPLRISSNVYWDCSEKISFFTQCFNTVKELDKALCQHLIRRFERFEIADDFTFHPVGVVDSSSNSSKRDAQKKRDNRFKMLLLASGRKFFCDYQGQNDKRTPSVKDLEKTDFQSLQPIFSDLFTFSMLNGILKRRSVGWEAALAQARASDFVDSTEFLIDRKDVRTKQSNHANKINEPLVKREILLLGKFIWNNIKFFSNSQGFNLADMQNLAARLCDRRFIVERSYLRSATGEFGFKTKVKVLGIGYGKIATIRMLPGDVFFLRGNRGTLGDNQYIVQGELVQPLIKELFGRAIDVTGYAPEPVPAVPNPFPPNTTQGGVIQGETQTRFRDFVTKVSNPSYFNDANFEENYASDFYDFFVKAVSVYRRYQRLEGPSKLDSKFYSTKRNSTKRNDQPVNPQKHFQYDHVEDEMQRYYKVIAKKYHLELIDKLLPDSADDNWSKCEGKNFQPRVAQLESDVSRSTNLTDRRSALLQWLEEELGEHREGAFLLAECNVEDWEKDKQFYLGNLVKFGGMLATYFKSLNRNPTPYVGGNATFCAKILNLFCKKWNIKKNFVDKVVELDEKVHKQKSFQDATARREALLIKYCVAWYEKELEQIPRGIDNVHLYVDLMAKVSILATAGFYEGNSFDNIVTILYRQLEERLQILGSEMRLHFYHHSSDIPDGEEYWIRCPKKTKIETCYMRRLATEKGKLCILDVGQDETLYNHDLSVKFPFGTVVPIETRSDKRFAFGVKQVQSNFDTTNLVKRLKQQVEGDSMKNVVEPDDCFSKLRELNPAEKVSDQALRCIGWEIAGTHTVNFIGNEWIVCLTNPFGTWSTKGAVKGVKGTKVAFFKYKSIANHELKIKQLLHEAYEELNDDRALPVVVSVPSGNVQPDGVGGTFEYGSKVKFLTAKGWVKGQIVGTPGDETPDSYSIRILQFVNVPPSSLRSESGQFTIGGSVQVNIDGDLVDGTILEKIGDDFRVQLYSGLFKLRRNVMFMNNLFVKYNPTKFLKVDGKRKAIDEKRDWWEAMPGREMNWDSQNPWYAARNNYAYTLNEFYSILFWFAAKESGESEVSMLINTCKTIVNKMPRAMRNRAEEILQSNKQISQQSRDIGGRRLQSGLPLNNRKQKKLGAEFVQYLSDFFQGTETTPEKDPVFGDMTKASNKIWKDKWKGDHGTLPFHKHLLLVFLVAEALGIVGDGAILNKHRKDERMSGLVLALRYKFGAHPWAANQKLIEAIRGKNDKNWVSSQFYTKLGFGLGLEDLGIDLGIANLYNQAVEAEQKIRHDWGLANALENIMKYFMKRRLLGVVRYRANIKKKETYFNSEDEMNAYTATIKGGKPTLVKTAFNNGNTGWLAQRVERFDLDERLDELVDDLNERMPKFETDYTKHMRSQLESATNSNALVQHANQRLIESDYNFDFAKLQNLYKALSRAPQETFVATDLNPIPNKKDIVNKFDEIQRDLETIRQDSFLDDQVQNWVQNQAADVTKILDLLLGKRKLTNTTIGYMQALPEDYDSDYIPESEFEPDGDSKMLLEDDDSDDEPPERQMRHRILEQIWASLRLINAFTVDSGTVDSDSDSDVDMSELSQRERAQTPAPRKGARTPTGRKTPGTAAATPANPQTKKRTSSSVIDKPNKKAKKMRLTLRETYHKIMKPLYDAAVNKMKQLQPGFYGQKVVEQAIGILGRWVRETSPKPEVFKTAAYYFTQLVRLIATKTNKLIVFDENAGKIDWNSWRLVPHEIRKPLFDETREIGQGRAGFSLADKEWIKWFDINYVKQKSDRIGKGRCAKLRFIKENYDGYVKGSPPLPQSASASEMARVDNFVRGMLTKLSELKHPMTAEDVINAWRYPTPESVMKLNDYSVEVTTRLKWFLGVTKERLGDVNVDEFLAYLIRLCLLALATNSNDIQQASQIIVEMIRSYRFPQKTGKKIIDLIILLRQP